ncbi:ABC transporter ATP-binding protein [Streptomyces stelliscabiei]|uniref:ABC transporter ATP-binding protein n=1 Tax=Streptomyces stelliscabiei TaxID=146820 RepID=UPI0029B8E20C|nr:ABC transporter ATP-binding protein [Streptomyces stelliscabiei]MDX3435763.1 ABC transporter ATP-binding protein [Streptomyces stelliscabiei]MDX3621938.1 ABC transporter ATP-binding protein [Streptomyces stelliscabiei]
MESSSSEPAAERPAEVASASSPGARPEPPAVRAERVTRVHRDGRRELKSLDQVSLTVSAGEVVAVTGPSGAGKTSLLHILGGLDTGYQGRACVAGTDWQTLRGNERAGFRRRTCGFVVQGLALLPQATAAENIEVPLLLDGVTPDDRRARVAESLALVGLADQGAKLPDQLSGGQQQRVAIARALVNGPALILADEPTGSLDSATAAAVVRLLLAAARERGAAVVLVTHDPQVARHADVIARLDSGRLDTPVRESPKE